MSNITRLLEQAGGFEGDAKLIELIYPELHQLAVASMRRERGDHTLQPTALVNEAYLRLFKGQSPSWKCRAHFFGAAARVMRQVLVDHARAKKRAKRDGDRHRVLIEDSFAVCEQNPELLVAIDEALVRLGQVDARSVQVVELRFFASMSVDETAEVLGLSTKTVTRDWEFARVWLEQQLRSITVDET